MSRGTRKSPQSFSGRKSNPLKSQGQRTCDPLLRAQNRAFAGAAKGGKA